MTFVLISILIPICTYLVLPWVLKKVRPQGALPSRAYLIVAGLLFFIAWYLPSPEIQGQQTSAVTHFIGGGVFTGIVWVYIKRYLDWQAPWMVELFTLLALVSFLGVMNELFELVGVHVGIIDISLDDTSWDLLMNTLGALTVWVMYQTQKLFTRKLK